MMRPRHLVFRGSVLASAYVLDDSRHARARVLERWRPGHEVFAWSRPKPKFLWRLPEPERVSCESAPGLPLVEQSGRLSSAPLDEHELREAPAGMLLTEAGEWVARPLAESVDPSQWLDLSALSLASVQSLGEVPAPPELTLVERPATDARTALGMAPLQAEGAAVAESLRTGAPLAAQAAARRPISIGPIARGVVSALRGLSRWFSRLGSGGAAGSGNPERGALAPPRAVPRWVQRLDAWFDRLLDASRLSRVLGQRQADYLARLMQMFEQGDLDAALRHAIPLGGQGPGDTRPERGVPTPRTSLALQLGGPTAAATSIALQQDYYEQLRRRYRAAAEKLEAEGRYADAAFVLAELLHADEEAVALLERHGKLQLAAELAEARRLPAGLQVRQWFLAKDFGRAVAVARRHGAFADAVTRLSSTGRHAESRQLRLLWADTQASSGDFYNAVATVWPLDDTRPLTRRWLELGIAAGGAQAARLQVKALVLGAQPVEPLLTALDDDDPERIGERIAILAELEVEAARLPPSRALGRAALRSSARNGLFPTTWRTETLERLAADGALKVDMPPYHSELKLSARTPPVRIDVEAYDKGALPVSDAALLPDGRMLLALGELGARVLTKDGRTAAHFEVPAHSLVTYDLGSRALCLAPRGEVVLVTRLDLVHGTAEPLKPQRLVSWARDTDGSMWFVNDGAGLCALDLHELRLPALWRVALEHPTSRPVRNALSLSVVVTATPEHLEWWRYELPSLTLRVRQQLQLPPVYERYGMLPDGNLIIAQGGVAWHQVGGQGRRQLTGVAGGVLRGLDGAGDWFSLLAVSEGTQRWMLADRQNLTVRHVVQLPRAAASIRMFGEVAVYSDEVGRVLAVDLSLGRLLRDLRVR